MWIDGNVLTNDQLNNAYSDTYCDILSFFDVFDDVTTGAHLHNFQLIALMSVVASGHILLICVQWIIGLKTARHLQSIKSRLLNREQRALLSICRRLGMSLERYCNCRASTHDRLAVDRHVPKTVKGLHHL